MALFPCPKRAVIPCPLSRRQSPTTATTTTSRVASRGLVAKRRCDLMGRRWCHWRCQVPGRFGRGFGRAPDVTPTAGGTQHDCRTFGCLRQAAGPSAATAVGEVHCCVMCFETEGRRHSRECDGGAVAEAPTHPRPWAPGAPRDNAGRRTDIPRHMDESEDPTRMDEVGSLKQRQQR